MKTTSMDSKTKAWDYIKREYGVRDIKKSSNSSVKHELTGTNYHVLESGSYKLEVISNTGTMVESIECKSMN